MSGSSNTTPVISEVSISSFWGLNDEELQAANLELPTVREWLSLKLKHGRCSFGLHMDLAVASIRGTYGILSVLSQIEELEVGHRGRMHTKLPTPFKNNPLRGLWHAHFTDAQLLVKNLANENSPKRIAEILASISGEFTNQVLREICHRTVIESYEQRATRNALTGEWIVYDPAPSGNYYLTIACHNEAATRSETDQKIYDRVDAYRNLDAKMLKQVREQGF